MLFALCTKDVEHVLLSSICVYTAMLDFMHRDFEFIAG